MITIGYMLAFSCFYIPQGHYFMVAIKYKCLCNVLVLSESPP